MRGNGLPCRQSCKEHFPLISCGGRLVRRNCFSNGYLWPLSRWLGKVCLPPKKQRKLRAFPFFFRAATGDACRCFHCCLCACPSGWGDGLFLLSRNQPQIHVEEAAIFPEHQPAAPAPGERQNGLPEAEHGTQEPSLASQPHPLLDLVQ